VPAIGFTHKMPMIDAIMTINMISNSFCTDALLTWQTICPALKRFHVLAVRALIRVKAGASFVWEEKSGKLNCSPE
jgi:hypothetical protein